MINISQGLLKPSDRNYSRNIIFSRVSYFQYITIASFATLVVMAIDRYIAIVHPLRSRKYRTKQRAFFACGMVWISKCQENFT